MTAPTTTDAASRSVVRLPDGRTGRLLYVPAPRRPGRTRKQRRGGSRARVQLPPGAVLSVDPSVLEIGSPS